MIPMVKTYTKPICFMGLEYLPAVIITSNMGHGFPRLPTKIQPCM